MTLYWIQIIYKKNFEKRVRALGVKFNSTVKNTVDRLTTFQSSVGFEP